LAAAGLCLAAGVAAGLGWRANSRVERADFASAVGQLRQVSLADGSQATLSSGSRIEVALRRGRRDIALDAGEAVFHAAKDPDRPFVVSAGARRVTAVGTVFAVRRDGQDLRVVVTEGLVRLDADPDGAGPSTLLPAGSIALAGPHGVLVRSVPLAQAQQTLDWQRGLLRFDDVPLAEAVAEFNRYSARPLVIGDDAAGALRVGGSFQWANSEGFVRLLERGFPVRAERRPDRIVLRSR
ncbi:MAG: FecR domain-containing protein, partial [Pseudoxanthomonas sp.]